MKVKIIKLSDGQYVCRNGWFSYEYLTFWPNIEEIGWSYKIGEFSKFDTVEKIEKLLNRRYPQQIQLVKVMNITNKIKRGAKCKHQHQEN